MKRPMFLTLCLLSIFAFSVACGGGSSSSTGTTPTPSGSSTVSTTPPASTPPPGPLSLIWTAPSKEVIVPSDQEVYINVRGESTHDTSATIVVAVDNDTNYTNGVLEEFTRTYPGGYFLVTISSSDFAPGTYYIVAKITRGAESLYRYLSAPITFTSTSTITLTTPATDMVVGWESGFTFLGLNNSGSANIFIGLDQDRNPTNGYAGLLTQQPDAVNYSVIWDVEQSYNGRYYPFVHVHEGGLDAYYYAPGSMMIGRLPSITFTSPLNRIDVHPKPAVAIEITGSSANVGTTGLMRIGYDTDNDPDNGGFTWLFTNQSIGAFAYTWPTQLAPGGPYYIVGQAYDEFGTTTNYAPGPIFVDPANYLELYSPLSDINIVADHFYPYPVFITGYAYTSAGTGTVTVYYATDMSDPTTINVIAGPFAEGAIDGIRLDVTTLPSGTFYVGATLQYGFTTIQKWAPMKISITPNTDTSSPYYSGPYFYATDTYAIRDTARSNKWVRWRTYYPSAGFGSTDINTGGPFPVVFFIPEYNTAGTLYSYLTTKLANWGYYVVVLDSTTNTSGYEYNRARADGVDCTFILDWLIAQTADDTSALFGRIDTTKVVAGGHGRGGGAAVIMSNDDDRLTAVYGLAPTRYYPYSPPYTTWIPTVNSFFMVGSLDMYDSPTNVQYVYDRANPFKEMVTLQGASHFQYLDVYSGWDNNPTMAQADVKMTAKTMVLAYINWILDINPDHKSWVNGAGTNSFTDITIQSEE